MNHKMGDYKLTTYIKPIYLAWTLEAIKIILNKYHANFREMKINHLSTDNPYHTEAFKVETIFDIDDKRLPYLANRLNKEPGIINDIRII